MASCCVVQIIDDLLIQHNQVCIRHYIPPDLSLVANQIAMFFKCDKHKQMREETRGMVRNVTYSMTC